ncbi:hypothetical protein ACLMJK_007906 [Lecanora helva]
MQEHIRRAHPQYYISKLPATEESFQLMINTPPSERPPPAEAPTSAQPAGNPAYNVERNPNVGRHSSPVPPRSLEDQYPAAATAAVALAQLHSHRPESDLGSEVEYASENEVNQRMHPSVELPPIRNHLDQQSSPPYHSPRPRELLPSMMAHSPPGRSSTLPPLQRRESAKREKLSRPRKSSITQNSRKPKHERTKSKDQVRRLSIEGRKAFSAEPPGAAAAAMGKRWEDLIEAATSATEADSDRDLTPVSSCGSSCEKVPNECADSAITVLRQAYLNASIFYIAQPELQSLASAEYSHTSTSSHCLWACAVPVYGLLARFQPFPILNWQRA